ncbi:uncharacterized protein LOC134243098 [Saccostrea cucullata]|uniref:uncharacterized protein LOC134243098 n=1 Tax=Saccostrea cuccullata TaxID=36930 RepID=UPI002ED5B67D
MAAPMTPRRVYLQRNICVICGFCFETRETDSLGNVEIKTRFNLKLKLTNDRLQNIAEVLGSLENLDVGQKGICIKCNRSVERILRLGAEVRELTEQIQNHFSRTQERLTVVLRSPGLVTKRLASSPVLVQPKKITKFPSVQVVVPVEIRPFRDITSTFTTRNSQRPETELQSNLAKPVRRSLSKDLNSAQIDSIEIYDGKIEMQRAINIINVKENHGMYFDKFGEQQLR